MKGWEGLGREMMNDFHTRKGFYCFNFEIFSMAKLKGEKEIFLSV